MYLFLMRFLGAITTGCMRPFVPRTNKNEITTISVSTTTYLYRQTPDCTDTEIMPICNMHQQQYLRLLGISAHYKYADVILGIIGTQYARLHVTYVMCIFQVP